MAQLKREAALSALYDEYQSDPAFRQLRKTSNFVPGCGSLVPRVMFIGEAPGAKEDKLGKPFVGASGKVLDKMLGEIGLDRDVDDVFITNIVKYRPPMNRDPTDSEKHDSLAYLRDEVGILRTPTTVLCPLGAHALSVVLPDEAISRAHGLPRTTSGGMTCVPMYHPATMLYNYRMEDTLRHDFLMLLDVLRTA